jgi:hypothetical protein
MGIAAILQRSERIVALENSRFWSNLQFFTGELGLVILFQHLH